jgi:hypothetical protein
MKRSIAVLIGVMFSSAAAVSAQTTVTNADLSKFREKRLQAEKKYRENYRRLGMPSPEELEKRRVEDIRATEELGTRLRRERQERERIAAEQARLEQLRTETIVPVYVLPGTEQPYLGSMYLYYGGGYGHRGRRFGSRSIPRTYYRAGGGGLIYEPGGRSSYVWSAPSVIRTPRIRSPR